MILPGTIEGMKDEKKLINLNKLIRRDIIEMTTAAQSGHPTSALSAVELMSSLMMGGFFDHSTDKLIFSKGHGSPLLYSLYHHLGHVTHEELLKFRQFDSLLEGHPVPNLPFIEVATGSLGQGISLAIGMAMAKKIQSEEGQIFVLCGDAETAEGQIYEALQIASHYKLDNIKVIIDVNSLGQSVQTMLGHDVDAYATRVSAFSWNTLVINDGHDPVEIARVYAKGITATTYLPTCFIARTVKGKGVAKWEGLNGFHSKQLTADEATAAIAALGDMVEVSMPKVTIPPKKTALITHDEKKMLDTVSFDAFTQDTGTKEVLGDALNKAVECVDRIMVLEGDMGNSTTTEKVAKAHPENYREMYIAEQNMVSAGVGLASQGMIPVISTFSSFFSRAYDQFRLARIGGAALKIFGAYGGVSGGMDGPSGMGLEDIAMMRSILDTTVLYPCDAMSMSKLTVASIAHPGMTYVRTTREKTPNLYSPEDTFPIGGSKTHFSHTDTDPSAAYSLIIGAGITVHEAIKAQKMLKENGVRTIVIDAYSVYPIDAKTISMYAKYASKVVVVEDHYPHGGLGDAVRDALINAKISVQFSHLCVKKIPKSGKPAELLAYEEIDAAAIVRAVETT